MEIENIIEYLIIGTMLTGKIIYEMKNTNDSKITYQIEELFKTYSSKYNLKQENIKVESYYINISDKLIMISKVNVDFSIEENLELFKKIRKKVPELVNYPLNIKKRNKKQDLSTKITNIIYDYFQYINANKQIITESYFKFPKMIFDRKNKNKPNNKINILINSKNNNNKNKEKDKEKDNTINKSSTREIFISKINNIYKQKKRKYKKNLINEEKNEKNKIENELILNQKKEEEENYNIFKSLQQSHMLFKINGRNNIINPNLISNYSMKFNRNNSKKKIIIIVIFVIIILIQTISIPFIIINSYSY